jgi:hypothetical protein
MARTGGIGANAAVATQDERGCRRSSKRFFLERILLGMGMAVSLVGAGLQNDGNLIFSGACLNSGPFRFAHPLLIWLGASIFRFSLKVIRKQFSLYSITVY